MAEDLLIRYSLDSLADPDVSLHLAHILCLEGKATFHYNGNIFELGKGDCAIIRATQLIETWETSEDFSVKIVYAEPRFIERATSNKNYGIRGSLSLFNAPVMHLTEDEFGRCVRDYEEIEMRLEHPGHRFHGDVLLFAMQNLILDISRLLRSRDLGFVEIADLFNFSSPSYFSRYVQRYLGLSATDYRG